MHRQARTFLGLTVSGLRRWLIYQPLAILLAILVLPDVSWMERAGGPFQAHAQIVLAGCAATSNSIIQNYCPNGISYFNDLVQLESDAVNAYVGFHGIPVTDAYVIYTYG